MLDHLIIGNFKENILSRTILMITTKKRAIFITVIGEDLYGLLRSFVAPAQPANIVI